MQDAQMPGMAAARDRNVAEDARKKEVDERAQAQERKRIAAAQAASSIELSMRTLQLDEAQEQRAHKLAANPLMQRKLRECAKLEVSGQPLKGELAQGAAMSILTARAEGEVVRAQNLKALIMQTQAGLAAPATVILEQKSRGDTNAGEIKESVRTAYPGMQIEECRKLGGDGLVRHKAVIKVDDKPHNVQTPMYRVTYMLQVSALDTHFIEAIDKQQDITLMDTQFQPHIVPGTEMSRATMTITSDTRPHLHVLMMQMAALGYSGIDAEAALLGLVRRTESEHEVLDVHVERELVPIVSKTINTEVAAGKPPRKPLQALVPDQTRKRELLYAVAVPTAVGALEGGIKRVMVVLRNTAQPGSKIVKAQTPTGNVVFTLDQQQTPTETTKYGLEGAKATAARQAAAIAKAPATWFAAAQTAVQEAMQQGKIAAPMTADQLSERMHPNAAGLIRTIVEQWNNAYRSCDSADQVTRANEKLAAELRAAEQQVNDLDMSVAEVNLSLKKQLTNQEWRALFRVTSNDMALHSIGTEFSRLCDSLQREAKLPIAAAALVVTAPDLTRANSQPWPQGVKGGSTLAVLKVWNSELRAFQDGAQAGHKLTDKVTTTVTVNGQEATLLVQIRQDNTNDAFVPAVQTAVESEIMAKVSQGGAVFVPTKMQDGSLNNLQGAVSSCPALADATTKPYDIRAKGFIPGGEYDEVLMPVMRKLIYANKIAPVISSQRDDQDSIAYMLSSYAKAIDAINVDWADIRYGTDIREEVRSLLQPSFMEEVTRRAALGLWTTTEMVTEGYARAEAGPREPPEMSIDMHSLKNSLEEMSHPFARDGTGNMIIAQLVPQKLVVLEMPQGALVLLRPDQNDLIPMLKDDDQALVELGGKIQYDSIKPPAELIKEISNKILAGLKNEGLSFFWLLAPDDATSGRVRITDCKASSQTSTIETIYPLAAQVLPESIWNAHGPLWSAAVQALDDSGELQAFPAKPSECGRKGMVAICQQGSVQLETTYGQELDDTLVDACVRVGDNETLKRALQGCKLRKLKEDMRKHLTTNPTVLVVLGARINDDGEPAADGTPFVKPGTILPMECELAGQLGRVQEQDRGDIIEALRQLLSARKSPVNAVNCASGILVMSMNHELCGVSDITERALQWDPKRHSIDDLLARSPPSPSSDATLGAGSGSLQQNAASSDQQQSMANSDDEARPVQAALGGQASSPAADDVMSVEETFSNLMEKIQKIKRSREAGDCIVIDPVSATSNVSFNSNFDAENATRRDDTEWAIQQNPTGQITFTLQLKEPVEILGLGTAHRADHRYAAFTQCYVQTPEKQMPEKKLTFTASREMQVNMLPAPFTTQQVQVLFSRDGISDGGGTPGLRGIVLLGREPADGSGAQAEKRAHK